MPKVLPRSGPGFFGRLLNIPLLTVAREVRSVEESPTRLPKEPAALHVTEIQPNRGLSIIAADLNRHAETLDGVAGSEFVDDRIRLRE